MFAPKLNSILLPQITDTLNIYPSPLYQVSNANWSAFLKGILPTLQSHGWNNGTHGGRQLDSEDLYLLPLAVWPTGVLLATVWASWLLIRCPWGWFLPPPSPPAPPHPTPPHLPPHPPLSIPPHPAPPPIPPIPSIINTDGRKGWQKIP